MNKKKISLLTLSLCATIGITSCERKPIPKVESNQTAQTQSSE